MTHIDIGIDREHRLSTAEGLKQLLADSYTLYLQTHNFHWNVEGPNFRELHLMFEEHYTELATAVDEIAERIRTLDVPAPGTFKEFAKLSVIEEVEGVPSATEMVDILTHNHEQSRTITNNHEQVVKTARKVLKLAQQADDESSVALVSDRMRIHEKTAWMLRSLQK
ncbi:DNA starvation/stationary phase protection protein [Vibrio parahaemolyticus]|uniref:Dps family protein n=3 Tax=Vibrio TaxID=662 RepID=UPI00111F92AE|nr:Dps family protein [Vibrio parahaemolyticus]MBE3813496.1 DNA starvation/stationary phase protection protein [Vibrio parahaemolyticus]MBE3883032.1 DNA starvation/stationary phase protection protein [Vibrio parahaemolyticus]MBE4174235.1 DNA starvation/stationary phase protection protein [Vibrio parahaemolyticus]MBE4233222.1 DNA starvation/stationary phase protection protein [Vibrio parahaemolyticus]MBE4260047.1 DNA starvation/stationary phase protection protein [Vibrio parahaemolyticus]